jgi:hypothetical protein
MVQFSPELPVKVGLSSDGSTPLDWLHGLLAAAAAPRALRTSRFRPKSRRKPLFADAHGIPGEVFGIRNKRRCGWAY